MKTLFSFCLLISSTLALADTFEDATDRPGSDYFNYEMYNPRAILCQNRCQSEARCEAWTYVKPGVQGAKARCWLKNAVPPPVKNSCCTSGVIE